jgi:hypothetical protein
MESLQGIAQSFHSTSLNRQLEEKANRQHLINILNYVHFQAGTILVNFRHPKYDKIISLRARPQPCLGKRLDCLWIEPTAPQRQLSSYVFLNFLLTDGLELILVQASVTGINQKEISFDLPDTYYQLSHRKIRRHACNDIQVDLMQNGATFSGFLQNFSAAAFCVEVAAVPPFAFCWVNTEATVYIIFKNKYEILYSGDCKIIRQSRGQHRRIFVLEPVNTPIYRFKPKEFPSQRQRLSPSPDMVFTHPLTHKTTRLVVEDLSGSGFAVEEDPTNSVLLPGLIIPELYLEFARDFKIKCKAQILSRTARKRRVNEVEDRTSHAVRCGITFLDMDIQDQVRLSALLHKEANKKFYVCNGVDLDALWKFFFETGFIYPKKYGLLHPDKEKFKATYERLYTQNPRIARHFVYQDKGTIEAHLSILRFYENTWLIHHHAASRSRSSKAGLVVLTQVEHYINAFHRLYSTHMNFIGCYFRPDNKFPNRVFGNCARAINAPKTCSIDSFAYFCVSRTYGQPDVLEAAGLTTTQPDDLLELESFYECESGGLMLHALDLEPSTIESDTLSNEYRQIGFKRERHLFSLKQDDALKAVIVVNVSDTGLNLSNLTNCIHVIVLDADLPVETIHRSLALLSKYYEQEEIPVLLYPVSYTQHQSVPYEKIYTLWILDTQYTDQYFQYMHNLLFRRAVAVGRGATVSLRLARDLPAVGVRRSSVERPGNLGVVG